MKKWHLGFLLTILNVTCVAFVWFGYCNYRRDLGLAGPKHIPDILMQLILPTVLIIACVTIVGWLLLYVGTYCLWKLRGADRKSRLVTGAAVFIVLAVGAASYADMYHYIDTSLIAAPLAGLVLFGLVYGVMRALPQSISEDRDKFQFLRP